MVIMAAGTGTCLKDQGPSGNWSLEQGSRVEGSAAQPVQLLLLLFSFCIICFRSR